MEGVLPMLDEVSMRLDGLETADRAPSEDEHRWQQVLARAPDAGFVYAVRTTGIYCRSICKSRKPRRENVRFFTTPAAAEQAGFRACLRCRPNAQPADAELVARLILYLERDLDRSVSLAELAGVAALSAGTVQRLFTRVVGLSPRAWVNARRAETYRALLAAQKDRITDAVYTAGFSSPSRAHQAAPLGMRAGRYREQGAGERIGYAFSGAAGLGIVLVASTQRGVCAVLLGDDPATLLADLKSRFPRAELAEDATLEPSLTGVLAALTEHPSAHALPLDLRGTAFQARVWAALRAIPRGQTRSYAQLAAQIGAPKAVRAVAAACGQNPAAILVPCHRVIGSDGKLTGYRWGLERKRALLKLEQGALPRAVPGSRRNADLG